MDFSNFTSRAMLDTDCTAVLTLWDATEGVEVAEGDTELEIQRYLEKNPGLSRVILQQGKIVGAVLCGHDGRRGLIYHLAVTKEWRGRGLGKRLVNDCLDGLRGAGIKRALILVDKTNDGGLRFWKRQYFEEIKIAIPMGRDVK